MGLNFKVIPQNKEWVVLYTKSRREKKVAQFCCSMGIIHFLPLETRIFMYGKKKIIRKIPLFPGYLFCCIDYIQRYEMLMTHQIAKILEVTNHKRLTSELEKIYIAQNAQMDLKPSKPVKKGQKVKIVSGPLNGYQGLVKKIKNNRHLILNIEMINCAASIDVDQMMVVPV